MPKLQFHIKPIFPLCTYRNQMKVRSICEKSRVQSRKYSFHFTTIFSILESYWNKSFRYKIVWKEKLLAIKYRMFKCIFLFAQPFLIYCCQLKKILLPSGHKLDRKSNYLIYSHTSTHLIHTAYTRSSLRTAEEEIFCLLCKKFKILIYVT